MGPLLLNVFPSGKKWFICFLFIVSYKVIKCCNSSMLHNAQLAKMRTRAKRNGNIMYTNSAEHCMQLQLYVRI